MVIRAPLFETRIMLLKERARDLGSRSALRFAPAEQAEHGTAVETNSGDHTGFHPSNAVHEDSKRLYSSLLKKVWADVQTDNCVDLAAEMSFYFILSIFPFLLMIASVVGWLPSTNVWHNFAEWTSQYLPRDSRAVFFHTVLGLTHSYSSFFSVGLIATVWAASSGFTSLMASLNVAYGIRESRGFWKRRMIAVAATAIAGIFLFGSFSLLTAGRWTVETLSGNPAWVERFRLWFEAGRWLTTIVLIFIGLDLMNYFLPDRKRQWHWVTSGTIFIAFTVIATSTGFNLYVGHFANYSRLYGALTATIILLIWIYIGSLILLIGAEIDNSMVRLKEKEMAI
jgi:membrane protein